MAIYDTFGTVVDGNSLIEVTLALFVVDSNNSPVIVGDTPFDVNNSVLNCEVFFDATVDIEDPEYSF